MERRAFNAERTEPGARQVPRREPAGAAAAATVTETAEGDAVNQKKFDVAVVTAQSSQEEGKKKDKDASARLKAEDYRSRRETLDPGLGLGRPFFHPEPIRFLDPEDDGQDGEDEKAIGGVARPVDGDSAAQPIDLLLMEVPVSPSIPKLDGEEKSGEVGGDEKERPYDKGEQEGEEEEEDKTETRDKRATWHTSRVTESNSAFVNDNDDDDDDDDAFLAPNNTTDKIDMLPLRPRYLGQSPHRPALTIDIMYSTDPDQCTRGRPRERVTAAKDTRLTRSSNSSKRTSMRSFAP